MDEVNVLRLRGLRWCVQNNPSGDAQMDDKLDEPDE
jgi:hypothetical protein